MRTTIVGSHAGCVAHTDPASAAFQAWCSAALAEHEAEYEGWSTDQLRSPRLDLRAGDVQPTASPVPASAIVQ